MKFIEVIGKYADGEAVDVLVNIAQIKCVRPEPGTNRTIIEFIHPDEDLLGVDEEYFAFKRRLLEHA